MLLQKSTSYQIFTRPSLTSFPSIVKALYFITLVGGEDLTQTPNSRSPTSSCGSPFECRRTCWMANRLQTRDTSMQYLPVTRGPLDVTTPRFLSINMRILPFLQMLDCLVRVSGSARPSQPLMPFPRVRSRPNPTNPPPNLGWGAS